MDTVSNAPIRFGGTPPTRAMLRRMMRNRLVLISAIPSDRTPAQVISDFCAECEIDMDIETAAELSGRLHKDGVCFFSDDGALDGAVISRILTAVCDALDKQADLIVANRWLEKNRLRAFQRELENTLIEFGLA